MLHFFAACLFARPHELGFDPTMTPVPQPDGTLQYDIVVRSADGEKQVYRTQELLSISRIDYPVGKGTRVWKAVKLENGAERGEPVALKDSWVDEHRTREGYTIASINKSAVEDELTEAIKTALLTVETHGDVVVEGLLDRTRPFPTEDASTNSPAEASTSSSSCASPHHTESLVHYRIVFKEVCEPLAEESSISRIFRALVDICKGK